MLPNNHLRRVVYSDGQGDFVTHPPLAGGGQGLATLRPRPPRTLHVIQRQVVGQDEAVVDGHQLYPARGPHTRLRQHGGGLGATCTQQPTTTAATTAATPGTEEARWAARGEHGVVARGRGCEALPHPVLMHTRGLPDAVAAEERGCARGRRRACATPSSSVGQVCYSGGDGTEGGQGRWAAR